MFTHSYSHLILGAEMPGGSEEMDTILANNYLSVPVQTSQSRFFYSLCQPFIAIDCELCLVWRPKSNSR